MPRRGMGLREAWRRKAQDSVIDRVFRLTEEKMGW